LYANNPQKLQEAKKRFLGAYVISKEEAIKTKCVYAVVTKDGVLEL
jgi:hypothetical protein